MLFVSWRLALIELRFNYSDLSRLVCSRTTADWPSGVAMSCAVLAGPRRYGRVSLFTPDDGLARTRDGSA